MAIAIRSGGRSCGFREVDLYETHGRSDGAWLDVMIVEPLIPENLSQGASFTNDAERDA